MCYQKFITCILCLTFNGFNRSTKAISLDDLLILPCVDTYNNNFLNAVFPSYNYYV